MKKLILAITLLAGLGLQAQVRNVYCQLHAVNKKLKGGKQTRILSFTVPCVSGLKGGFDQCCRSAITIKFSAAAIFTSK